MIPRPPSPLHRSKPDPPDHDPADPSTSSSSPTEQDPSLLGTVASALFFLFIVVICGLSVYSGVRSAQLRDWLDRYGVQAQAHVVGSRAAPEFAGQKARYLDVEFGDHVATVKVCSNRHPIGSWIGIRYDPRDPTHAVATEDFPGGVNPMAIIYGVVAAGLLGSLVWATGRTWSQRRLSS